MVLNSWMQFVARERPILASQRWSTSARWRKAARCHGGIVPTIRRRSRLALRLVEREDISRGIAVGWLIRKIAEGLGRSASTVSREVSRHGVRSDYRATEADNWLVL
jgi:DNA-binding NarL/FixJ family response regulator